MFQHDGDPKYTAIIVEKWLAGQKFQTMQRPAQSPDLKPLENLWAIVKIMLSHYERAPTNMAELWERVNIEWAKVPHQTIQNLVESMPKRIKSVLANNGLWTKY